MKSNQIYLEIGPVAEGLKRFSQETLDSFVYYQHLRPAHCRRLMRQLKDYQSFFEDTGSTYDVSSASLKSLANNLDIYHAVRQIKTGIEDLGILLSRFRLVSTLDDPRKHELAIDIKRIVRLLSDNAKLILVQSSSSVSVSSSFFQNSASFN